MASASLLLWCAGCATDQAADVAAYRAISDPTMPPTQATKGEQISLVDALRRTAYFNERLASRGESYVQALADQRRAAAALRPTAEAFATVAIRENAGDDGILQSALGLNGQYRLLTGMSDLRNVDAAKATMESRRWLILDLRESLLLETASAYYETLRSERLVKVLESSVAAQSQRLQDTRARNEVGFARPLDVAQNEAQVSRTRTQLIDAKRQADESRAALSLLTGTRVTDSVLTDGFEPLFEPRELEQLLQVATQYRQDVLAARADAIAAQSKVDAAIGAYAPSISINLDYFLARGPDDSAAAIASLINIRVPLFSADRIEADVQSAWSIFRQRVLDYRLRLREVGRDVEVALLQLRSSTERTAELRTQVQAARDTLELAEAAYQAGLGTNLEIVTAQDQLLAAELEATSEQFTGKVASLSLRRAIGMLSTELIDTPLPEVPQFMLSTPDSPFLDREKTLSTQPAQDHP